MTQSWEDYSDSWENTKSGTLATDISEGYYLSAVAASQGVQGTG
ncbi:hypothetical protein [Piscirickettsia salmonis]|nr:hypothetical protein [Piscirickettsia salmonis]